MIREAYKGRKLVRPHQPAGKPDVADRGRSRRDVPVARSPRRPVRTGGALAFLQELGYTQGTATRADKLRRKIMSKASLLRAARSGGSAAVRSAIAGEAAVVAAVEVGQSYRVVALYTGVVVTARVTRAPDSAGVVLMEDASGAVSMYFARLLRPEFLVF